VRERYVYQSPDRDSHLTTDERRCTASHSNTGILLKSGFHEEILIFSGSLTHSRYDLKSPRSKQLCIEFL